jgi:hypothetical protein
MNLEDIEERFKKRLKEAALKEIIDIREPLIITNLSLPRRRESSDFKRFWIPAFAGMTLLEAAINYRISATQTRKRSCGSVAILLVAGE